MNVLQRSLLLLLFCISFLYTRSQNKKTDSLLFLLKTDNEDTIKVNHLNGLAFELRNSDPKQSLEKASEALKVAEKLIFWPGIIRSFISIGTANVSLGKTDEAISCFEKGKNLAQEYDFPTLEAKSLMGLASAYKNKGDYKKVISAYNDAHVIFEKLKDKKNIAAVYNGIGGINNSQGNYNGALDNHLKALKIRTELTDKNGIAGSYNNLGNVYKNLNNFSEALTCFYKAIEINKETGNEDWLANNYGNLSTVYFELAVSPNLLVEGKTQGQYFSDARETAMKAVAIKEKGNDKESLASLYHNIALIDVEQAKVFKQKGDIKAAADKLKLALKIYNVVLKIREEMGDKYHLAILFENIALLHFENEDYVLSKKYFEKSLPLSFEVGSLEQLKADYFGLSVVDSVMGNYREAYKHYRLYIKYRDSIENKENTKKVTETRMNFEFGLKQAADSIKGAEKEMSEKLKHQQEIKQQRSFTLFGVIGFILMIVVAAVSFKAFRQKQKDNTIITSQKQTLEQKQKEVMDSIQYAQRIQKSLLPNERYLDKKLQELKTGNKK